MSQWFENWFEAPEYLELYRHRNSSDAEKMTELILGNMKLVPGASVLDLACGAGRHAISFAKKGYKVTGIDLSENLLSFAREKSAEAGTDIEFIRQDVRELNLGIKFDMVVNLFTSFGYFETDGENFLIFDIAGKHLKTGGFFIFDYFNPEYLKMNLVPFSCSEFGSLRVEQSREISAGRVIKHINIYRGGKSQSYMESVKLYDPITLQNELSSRDYIIHQIYGDYYGSSFSSNDSERIIIFAEKV